MPSIQNKLVRAIASLTIYLRDMQVMFQNFSKHAKFCVLLHAPLKTAHCITAAQKYYLLNASSQTTRLRAQSCIAETARQRAMMRATALHCKLLR